MSVPSPRPGATPPAPDPLPEPSELPEPWRRSLDSAARSVRLLVDRENVLAVRSVLLGEAERLLELIRVPGSRADWVGRCAGDPVSGEAADAFNARISRVLEQCRRYAVALRAAGMSLDEVARRYGYTDAQIAASFRVSNAELAG